MKCFNDLDVQIMDKLHATFYKSKSVQSVHPKPKSNAVVMVNKINLKDVQVYFIYTFQDV